MQRRSTRYRADWLVPVATQPLANGALLVDDGRIIAVGNDADVPRPADAENVDLGHAVLMPGMVNVHAHPELTALRGALEDLPFDRWIPELLRLKRAARLNTDDLRTCARWQLLEAHAAGITTLGTTEDSDGAFVALLESGGRGVAYRETFGPEPAQAEAGLGALQQAVTAMRRDATDLVHVGVSPHSPYTVADALFSAVADYARAEQLPLAVHIAESSVEVALVTRASGAFADGLRGRGIVVDVRARSPLALLDRLGLLALQPLLIHCIQIDGDDVARIAANGASVAHCPVANARLGHGIAPITELMAANVTIGLGSDSMASNNRMDILEEARTAQLMQRVRLRAPDVMDAATLVRLATVEGARALGLDERIGTLEQGKDADLCAVTLDGAHTRPALDPLVTLVHSARASDVIMAAVRGRVLYRDGRHLTLARNDIQAAFDRITARVTAARAAPP